MGPKPIGVWLGGSPPKRKNVDIAAKWDRFQKSEIVRIALEDENFDSASKLDI